MTQNPHHVWVDMFVEPIEIRAQVIQAALTSRCSYESVFGALTPAKLQVVTLPALTRKVVTFVHTELLLNSSEPQVTDLTFTQMACTQSTRCALGC